MNESIPPVEMCRRMVGRAPLFWLACVVMVALWVAVELGWLGRLGVMGLVAGLVGWLRGWKSLVWTVVIGGVAWASFAWRSERQERAERGLLELGTVEVQAVALKNGKGMGGTWTTMAEIEDGPWAGEVIWWQGRGTPPVEGSRMRARGDFLVMEGPRNPGEFDTRSWMQNIGVVGVFDAQHAKVEIVTPRWAEFAAGVKAGFRERVTMGLDAQSEEAQMIRAMVIGESPTDADEVVQAFRNSGTLHAFSVSGLHVGMVGGMAWMVLAGLRVKRRYAVWLLIPTVFAYSWLTGNSIPALRSAWMASLYLTAFAWYRRPNLLNLLGCVWLVMLVWHARLLLLPGVQLSYGVVAAIAIGTQWVERSLAWMTRAALYQPEKYRSGWESRWMRMRQWLSQTLAVSVAASLGSAPMTAYHFGMVTPVSIIASVVLIPWVFVILAMGLLGVLVSPVGSVARVVNQMNGQVAHGTGCLAKGLAAIPYGTWHVGGERYAHLRVYDLQKGASAAVFTDGEGESVMIDAGDFRQARLRLLPSMSDLDLQPESIVFTHPDGQHMGGGYPLWKFLPLRQVVMPVESANCGAYEGWMAAVQEQGLKCFSIRQGDGLPFPAGAWLSCAWKAEAEQGRADDRVALYRLEWAGWRFLFTSDAGRSVEQQAVASGVGLQAEVIVADDPVHDAALSDEFLEVVQPRVIVLPRQRAAKAPVVEQIAHWRAQGIRVLDLGQTGGLCIHVDEAGALVFDGYLRPRAEVLQAWERGGK